MRVSINQPYFIPYAGYYRLFHEVDLHVIYDDVQFPYPGYVHRNQLTNRQGEMSWLTIPLKKMSLDTPIRNMQFSEYAASRWVDARRKFPVFDQRPLPHLSQMVALGMTHINPLDFILSMMDLTRDRLGFDCKMVKSSRYKWSMFNRGQERVIEICKRFKATEYVNASGGASLYDPAEFEKAGIKLRILKPYEGSKLSILERLATEDRHAVRKEIIENVEFIS